MNVQLSVVSIFSVSMSGSMPLPTPGQPVPNWDSIFRNHEDTIQLAEENRNDSRFSLDMDLIRQMEQYEATDAQLEEDARSGIYRVPAHPGEFAIAFLGLFVLLLLFAYGCRIWLPKLAMRATSYDSSAAPGAGLMPSEETHCRIIPIQEQLNSLHLHSQIPPNDAPPAYEEAIRLSKPVHDPVEVSLPEYESEFVKSKGGASKV